MSGNYNEASIQSMDIIEHIQHRPSAYIENTNIFGQFKLIKEALDNSFDELENIAFFPENYLELSIIYNKNNKSKYIVSIIDNGRGIPTKKIVDVFTKQNTSGKFNTDSYKTSGGLLGLGSKVVYALSDISKVIAFNNGSIGALYNNHKSKIIHDYPVKSLEQNIVNVYNNILNKKSGTILQFQISNKRFQDIDKFIDNKFDIIFNLLKKIALFKNKKFRIISNLIEVSNNKIFTLFNKIDSIKDKHYFILNYLNNKNNKTILHFDSNEYKNDIDSYLYNVINLLSIDNKQLQIVNKKDINYLLSIMNTNLLSLSNILDSSSKLKLANITLLNFQNDDKRYNKLVNELMNKKIAIVNDIVIEDNNSYHISILIKLLKEQFYNSIIEDDIKEFILSNNYKLPFIFLIDIQYSEAQFVGTTKHAFRDIKFRNEYTKYLKLYIEQNKEQFSELFKICYENIIDQYNRFYNKSFIAKSNKKILLELNRPDKFMDCLTSDRSKAELFLFEGDSAKSSVGRDSEFQALYSLSGKTINAMTTQDKTKLSIQILKKNKIFNDIIRLLNIAPNTEDLSTLNFNKIFILSDADDSGYHIASVIIGNLYLYNKYFIEQGHLHIVIPPLYSLQFKRNNSSLYIRSEYELVYSLCKYIYIDIFDILVDVGKGKITLPKEAYIIFMETVFKLAKEIEDISKELNIPPILTEALLNNYNILSKLIITKEDLNILRNNLNIEIKYDKNSNLFIFSIGLKDYIVTITNIKFILFDRLFPIINKINYHNLNLFIKSKLIKDAELLPISIVSLYQFCKNFENLYTIKRFKGIGSMPNDDRKISCMDKSTRSIYQISEIGDLDKIYGSLGSSSKYRKTKHIKQGVK